MEGGDGGGRPEFAATRKNKDITDNNNDNGLTIRYNLCDATLICTHKCPYV